MGRHRGTPPEDAPDSPRPDRVRRRRGRRRAFAALSAACAILLALALGGWLLFERQGGCGGQEIPLSVAAAPELAPALTELADAFNDERHAVDGRCVRVEVRGADPADVAYAAIGADPAGGGADSDVWIPDSSLWQKIVQRDAAETTLTGTGTSVARTPLLVAQRPGGTDSASQGERTPSWETLLPTAAPGAESAGVQVIDPLRSSSGLAALALVHGAIGGGDTTSPELVAALQNLQRDVSADEASAFEALRDGSAQLVVLSEQAALRYNTDHPDAPARVGYPEDGTYTLDYPYLLRTDDALAVRAAEAFRGQLVRQEAQAVVRAAGFRSADGTADASALDGAAGFRLTPPDDLPTPSDGSVTSLLRAWNQLQMNSRMLAVLDISGSMAQAVPGTGLTRMQVTTQAASQGLGMFPRDAEIGLWEFSVRIDGDRDHREVVPIRPLGEEVDGGTHQEVLGSALAGIRPEPDGDTGLYDTILAAYREMTDSYRGDRVNTILVLTDGSNDDDRSVSLDELLEELRDAYDPDRPVSVISIAFGPDADPEPLRQVADATHGAAYATDDPTEIGDIFLESFALRVAEDE
ncbi:substrate-binding domain-containing protein [Marinitenerispora sediminis]|uniref:substrate-binding domain-containing protein n=1 Tax=Marinitenerispora sediminis TaxID=1931232 RepID=UPI001F283E18|nr:substrate-binding domain-containing protein [Marinitenerispora sediminis]